MKRSAFNRLGLLVVVSLLIGIVLAFFQPTLAGSGDLREFTWPAIGLRFCLYGAGCFAAFGLLLFPQKIARWFFRWRVLKWSLLVLATLLALIGLCYIEEDWRCKHAWDNYRCGWEAKGEHFDFASFIPAPVADNQNFALTPIVASCYLRYLDKNGHRLQPENTNVMNRLEMEISRDDVWKITNANLGDWRQSKRINLGAWQQYYRNPPDTNYYKLDTNVFPTAPSPQKPPADVLFALSKYDSTVEEVRQAADQFPRSRFPLNYEFGSPSTIMLPHMVTLLESGKVLVLRATAELANDQNEKALKDVWLLLRLADAIHGEPVPFSQYYRLCLLSDALQPIWEGTNQHEWSDNQLTGLNLSLGGLDLLADYPAAMRGARAINIATIEFMRRHRSEAWNATSSCGNNSEAPVPFLVKLVSWLVPSGWFYANEATIGRIFQPTLPAINERRRELFSVAAHRAETMAEHEHQNLSPYNAIALMTDPNWGLLARKFIETQSSIDLARVACALERFRLSHGEYSENLDQLAPQFIASVPLDVINGQPLHYRRTTDGSFVLYSVGWNEKDDGGTPGVSDTGNYDYRKGDWVWQYPKP